jgi:ribosomal protein S18 acetylase RimI-like enzyme
MNPHFSTLEQLSLEKLTQVFNAAFAHYAVPISFTPESLAVKMRCEGIDLSISAGAFVAGQLVGFMLFAGHMHNGHPTVWNGGTGVLPKFRGHTLTQKMYAFITPLHKTKGFEYSMLEVMEENTAARKNYLKCGLQEIRAVDFYSTQVPQHGQNHPHIRPCKATDLPYNLWHEWQPTWQHTSESIIRAGELYTTLGYFDGEVLKGYCVCNISSGRIIQLAVHPTFRRMGIATALLNMLCLKTAKPLSVLNVDAGATEASAFLNKRGFKKVLRQVEMGMSL